MKKSLFCLLITIVVSASVHAQLANTKWKGILALDNPVNVTFNFGKDTLSVYNIDENHVLETMTFTADKTTFTLLKVSGQSDCPTSTAGKYKYQIKDDKLLMMVVDDACNDRAPYLNNLQLVRDLH